MQPDHAGRKPKLAEVLKGPGPWTANETDEARSRHNGRLIADALTGPLTAGPAKVTDDAVSLQRQNLKAMMPWSHKRKNWMRGVNVTEGAIDVGLNTAALAAEAVTLGAASVGTAGIAAGSKTGFSLMKSRVRRESKQRALTRMGTTASAEMLQGMIPFAGSGLGVAAGAKQMVQSTNLDSIAPERVGDRSVLKELKSRIERSGHPDSDHYRWLVRQEEKAQHRFDVIDAKARIDAVRLKPRIGERKSKLRERKMAAFMNRNHGDSLRFEPLLNAEIDQDFTMSRAIDTYRRRKKVGLY